MPSRGVVSIALISLLCLCAMPARAQQPLEASAAVDPPAHVSFVDGAATLERDGQPDASPLNMPLLAGDRIRTQEGRVEILFADGSTLHLDRRTIVDFQSDDLVRLLDGRVRLAIPGAREVLYRIDAPWASAEIGRGGEYRVSVLSGDRGDEIELAVLRGAADLVNEQGRTPLRAGQRAFARANVAPSYAYVFNSASWDAFDQWSEARRDQRLGVSAEYLPESVRPYAASFDAYGDWRYETTYGYVWYPRVTVGWRPYYHGRWVTLRPYGWTWIGYDPWAWPTHHYGRWGFTTAGAWYWIPGRTWGAAWVSWAYAPGYVSWCPLGWNNYPVVPIGSRYRHARYNPWHAWTAVPQRHFTRGSVNVRAGAVDIDAGARAGFSPGTRPPASGSYAVPRATAPIRVAGTGGTGVRTSSSPLYTNLPPAEARVGTAPSRTMIAPSGNAARPRPGVAAGAPAAPAADRTSPSFGTGGGQRPDYGARDRTPARAITRDVQRDASPAPSRSNAPIDHGVGGTIARPAGRPVERAPAAVSPYGGPSYGPAYGVPRERADSPYGGQPSMDGGGRARPRDDGGRAPQGYRPEPRQARPDPGMAPRSPGAAAPRAERPSGVERPSGGDRPSAAPRNGPGGGTAPSAAPRGARPRGGG